MFLSWDFFSKISGIEIVGSIDMFCFVGRVSSLLESVVVLFRRTDGNRGEYAQRECVSNGGSLIFYRRAHRLQKNQGGATLIPCPGLKYMRNITICGPSY